MSTLTLDHLAVVARTLAEGCEYIQDSLGIDIPFGGVHPHMGTHNCLAKLGDDEFLEVIAINPEGKPPNRPRWFNIDSHGDKAPYLAHWIARTDNITTTLAQAPAQVGPPMDCTRGELTWQLSVPDDGSFAYGGAFPSIIEWPMRPYPGAAMAEVGCHLQKLSITHPTPNELNDALSGLFDDKRLVITEGEKVTLSAAINTPTGLRTLK